MLTKIIRSIKPLDIIVMKKLYRLLIQKGGGVIFKSNYARHSFKLRPRALILNMKEEEYGSSQNQK